MELPHECELFPGRFRALFLPDARIVTDAFAAPVRKDKDQHVIRLLRNEVLQRHGAADRSVIFCGGLLPGNRTVLNEVFPVRRAHFKGQVRNLLPAGIYGEGDVPVLSDRCYDRAVPRKVPPRGVSIEQIDCRVSGFHPDHGKRSRRKLSGHIRRFLPLPRLEEDQCREENKYRVQDPDEKLTHIALLPALCSDGRPRASCP